MIERNFQQRIRLIFKALYYVIFLYLIVTPLSIFLISAFVIKANFDVLISKKIKWAPLNVPLKRRLETLAALVLAYYGFLCIPSYIFLNIILLYYQNNFWRIVLIANWVYNFYDHYTNFSVKDGMGCLWLRTSALGRYARSYFPVELVKTVDLKPDKNYLIAAFPHGILTVGSSINMCLHINKWLELYPGIRPLQGTIDFNFSFPFIRNYLRWHGFVSISKESLEYYLSKSNDAKHPDNHDGYTSNAISISIGGAKEATDNKPGRYKLTIKNRKGFVRIAIKTGASIVPAFTFNEVDSYEQMVTQPGTLTYRFQCFVKGKIGLWPSSPIGRGFFQYTAGLLPHRNRLVQVIGAPIDVEKCEAPDSAYIDEIHEKVVVAIQELFDTYKDQYLDKYKDAKLILT